MSILMLIILILASFRVTRLLVDDTITDFYRNKFIDWHENTHSQLSHFFLTLFTCFWCVGFWVSGVVVTIYSTIIVDWIGFMEYGLLWFAVAGGAAVTGTIVNKLED